MTDYEIRYYHADGSLALIRMSNHVSDDQAANHAREKQGDFARFEVFNTDRQMRHGGRRFAS